MTKNENVHPKLICRRAHMANERTFLAWVRTTIGIMAFGFAVERFAFVDSQESIPPLGITQLPGLLLVAFGVVITAFAFIRYWTIENELDKGGYTPNLFLTTALTLFIIVVGIFLFIYLASV